MKKIFISAGDTSGDMHAAKLMKALKMKSPDIEFIGIGGKEMELAGLKSLIPLEEISVVGFWEVAKKYSTFNSLLKKCKSILENEQISAFVPVDYPGFNLRLAACAKINKIPVLYYIAPQLWAWGENRAKKLVSVIDKLYTVFPFEEAYFRKFGIDAEFVGHPLMDIPKYEHDFMPFEKRDNTLLLFPGSRKQEIVKHTPLLINTADLFHKHFPDYRIAIAKNNTTPKSIYEKYLAEHKYIELEENPKQAMLQSKIGIIKTGTSNLEAALSGMPFVMYYLTSFLTYNIGKKVINLNYISLINILENRSVIKELIQQDATPEKIVKEIIDLCENEVRYQEIQNTFRDIKMKLGGSGASQNTADRILEYIKR